MPAKTKFELKPGLATREAFGKALAELGKVNPNVVVLDADLSKSTYTAEFGKAFPDRFFECGTTASSCCASRPRPTAPGGRRCRRTSSARSSCSRDR